MTVEAGMRRVIGMDLHRTFAEFVIWEEGRLRHHGRIDMIRTALEGFGKFLQPTDEVVIEATGNCMAMSRMIRLANDWLPRPRILHPWPRIRFAVKHPRQEPDAGIPLVWICAGGAQ